jgi:hypothetical protein
MCSTIGEVGRMVPAGSSASRPTRGKLKKSRRNRGALRGDFHYRKTDSFSHSVLLIDFVWDLFRLTRVIAIQSFVFELDTGLIPVTSAARHHH